MPSPKSPLSTISPGPGKLPAGTVSASAFLPGVGGGGGASAALLAHITDPVDAHMASAIGVNPTNPVTGLPILSLVGGPVDGESVLDFITQAKDLFPDRPNVLGALGAGIPNSGIPSWDTLDPVANPTLVQGGAWTNGTTAVFSHFILADVSTLPTGAYGAITYPADRGVLAVYRSTDGDYLNPGTTTLYAALWLGSTANQPAALTCSSANFQESLRESIQPGYFATNVGLDQITLNYRVGYLKDYTPYGSIFADYAANFFAYQIAVHGINFPATVSGSNDSWLVVHWREGYAVSDASIAPAALLANYNATNVYSEVPGNYDAVPVGSAGVQALNRRYVFQDILSAQVPTLVSWAALPNGVPTTVSLSGVEFYDNGGTPLTWDINLRVAFLFANAWLPGSTSGPELPSDFVTADDPIEYDWSDFGSTAVTRRAYYQLRSTGSPSTYTISAAPLGWHQAQDLTPSLAIPAASPHTPPGGIGKLRAVFKRPFVQSASQVQLFEWLFNSWPQTVGTSSTPTFEPFRDEKYRYVSTHTPTVTDRIDPSLSAPPAHYNSTTVITAGTADAQVIGDAVVYPQVDYSPATFRPVGQPNYAAVQAADPTPHERYFQRAFDTGVARSTGKIRVKGLNYTDFAAGPFTGVLSADHPGGVALLLKVPGVTGSLDLGRLCGDPDLNVAANFRGCQVAREQTGPDEWVITYNMGAFTGNNGFGEFPLFFAVALIKPAGLPLQVQEVEWLPP